MQSHAVVMDSEKKPESTQRILTKLGLLLVAFYGTSFALTGLLLGCFDLRFRGTLQFELELHFSSKRETAAWLCQILCYLLEGIFIGVGFHNEPRAWDYSLTVALIHLLLSCAVMQHGPTSWVWWLTFILVQPVVVVLAHAFSRCFKKTNTPVEMV
eukprot:TRINITY_DN11703_c0_g2_i1.p2 TRINITY_DN11703_c0_g2~~TRINITY_DN11703_c0_g2_i1.p2  ORF type:complete len:156 (+),score=8.75 TRINITY_DN11703_c0_g2_i1:3990-4457(+)